MSHIIYDTKDIYIIPKNKNPIRPTPKPKKPTPKGPGATNPNIDNDTPKQPKTISKSLSTQIQQKRTQKHMTQKELAQKVNVKVDIIQKYENGTIVVDPAILNKIRRVLEL